jgi:hypothetical protein
MAWTISRVTWTEGKWLLAGEEGGREGGREGALYRVEELDDQLPTDNDWHDNFLGIRHTAGWGCLCLWEDLVLFLWVCCDVW